MPTESEALEQRHLFWGWLAITLFVALGLALEAMHGLKVGFLLDVDNETRRHMWTLAHAHGTLLGLMNVGFAWTLTRVPDTNGAKLPLASGALLAATLMIPAGFFLGGLTIYAGDPGLGILLVPPGGLLLLFAAYRTVTSLRLPAQ